MVRIEKQGAVWTVVHSRFAEARNAMDPDSADALAAAFKEFDADDSASVAVLWGEGGAFCAGWDLKFASTLSIAMPFTPCRRWPGVPDRRKPRAARSARADAT
jgi:enoyl-CoA hydratase